ncbi:transmembrane protein 70, mitochondrial [Protopterus annectens]|uniref:transmembrane protein 70, mitochondrial n=1 Tax=Protopterus annectens TaxID=7888 RepID=UPI001CFB2C82|nr:transmembrane protein 70, mitochondrial [Protopterus annectens]
MSALLVWLVPRGNGLQTILNFALKRNTGIQVPFCPFSRSVVTGCASLYIRPSRRVVHKKLELSICSRDTTGFNLPGNQNKVVYFGTSSNPEELDQGRLIYVGNLARSVLGVKLFSYSSSVCSLCVMPYILFKTGIGYHSIIVQAAFYVTVGLFTFITPVALHFITKGYVVRLYHNSVTDTYTAITYSVFLAEKKTVFHQSDVTIPGVSKMFTTFYAKNSSMLINPMLFLDTSDYKHLLGYDKPFAFDAEEFDKSDKDR